MSSTRPTATRDHCYIASAAVITSLSLLSLLPLPLCGSLPQPLIPTQRLLYLSVTLSRYKICYRSSPHLLHLAVGIGLLGHLLGLPSTCLREEPSFHHLLKASVKAFDSTSISQAGPLIACRRELRHIRRSCRYNSLRDRRLCRYKAPTPTANRALDSLLYPAHPESFSQASSPTTSTV